MIFDEIRGQNHSMSVYLEEANVQLRSHANFVRKKHDITTSRQSVNAV